MSSSITSSHVFDLLLEACPTARPSFELDKEDNDGLPYVQISVFAREIVGLEKRDETQGFNKFFGVIEQIIADGDEAAKGLAIVGFLESLQNNASWTDRGPIVFEKWLGPKSIEAWRDLERLWEGKSSLADVVRSSKA
jgi:hypothetical protein